MNDTHWTAITQCDDTYDGKFYYGVKTTGIFCRPSCKSRTPSPANVEIFATASDAQKAGFRACKRCRPDRLTHRPDEELAETVKAYIDGNYTQRITLQSLSAKTYVSPYHLQRTFRKVMDVSPVQYVTEIRIRAAKHLLQTSPLPISDIAKQTGFGSGSRFSFVFSQTVGIPPTAFREQQTN